MKRVYWRPRKASKPLILALGLFAVAGTILAERMPLADNAADRGLKLAAARLADKAFQAIRDERLRMGHQFVRRLDPGHTGLIGDAMSLATSLPADLEAKQTSVNPNFAAAIVDMLLEADVQPGDWVAVGCTGSFPALNICTYAALETLGARPVIIHSICSSQYGANHPDLLWLDMESRLHDRGLITYGASAATLGGYGDRAVGASPEARDLLETVIERNGVQRLHVEKLAQSIDARLAYYHSATNGEAIKAYINVGGGAASIRGSKGKAVFEAGLNYSEDVQADAVDCVAARFAVQGVPVIHLADAVLLARQYGLAVAPTSLPAVGDGRVYRQNQPNRILAGALLAVMLSILRLCVWTDQWERFKEWLQCRMPWRHDRPLHCMRVLRPLGAELSV
jgi:poly-gamma-glutamate system protein